MATPAEINIPNPWGRILLAAGLIVLASFLYRRWNTRLDLSPPVAGAKFARVQRVIDGDTLVIESGQTIRILGLDTPETHHPDMQEPQAFGLAASQRLRDWVEGRPIWLESDREAQDHYGRELRHVWAGQQLVSESLIREGLAYALVMDPQMQHAALMREAEASAKSAGRGLWSIARPSPHPIFQSPDS